MPKPNIVLIVTDDQPRKRLDAMPYCSRELRDEGLTFATGIARAPLCSVSRASLLTGMLPTGHGVWDNVGEHGGWGVFQHVEDASLGKRLRNEANYFTGLIGKYINGWAAAGGWTPPGWDRFRGIMGTPGDGAYFNYILKGTGVERTYGSDEADYSTDVLANEAVKFIEDAPADQPLFLYFAPYGAHAGFTPAPRHAGLWDAEPVNLSPAVNHDTSTMSPWLHDLPEQDEAELIRKIRQQHETVMSVDEAVQRIRTEMIAHNRTDTLYVLLGDNGLQFGEHRLEGKYVPYRASSNLPMFLRWNGMHTHGGTIRQPMTLEAMHDTILNAGLTGTLSYTAEPCALMGAEHEGRPAYIGWRSRRWMYCQYADGGEELYDYDTDPDEMVNVIATQTDTANHFRALAAAACHPLPPGWN